MGQKINPIGLRLGINRGWDPTWFAKKRFCKYLIEDFKIRNYIKKYFKFWCVGSDNWKIIKKMSYQFIHQDQALLLVKKVQI